MLNLSDYKEHFCEYILFRYAWANEFVKEPFPENLYEYYDSFAKAYRYLIEKIGYPVLYCGVTTSAEQILEPILAKCRMKYEQYHNLLKLYDQDEPYLMLVLQDNQQTDQRGLNVFGNAFNGGGLYISYGKSYQCWIQKAFQSLDCPIAEPMLRYFIDRSAYAYQERRDGKDETIDLYQIAIFIKQIAFASMDAGVSKETIDQVVPAAVGKSWELASKLLLDPMEGMKLAVELFDHGNNSLKLYGMLLRNYRVAKKALLLSDMKENEILKLLGLTEKQMRGIRAYRKLPEERLDTVMSILIEAMNRTKISFGNERNLFIQTMAKLIIL